MSTHLPQSKGVNTILRCLDFQKIRTLTEAVTPPELKVVQTDMQKDYYDENEVAALLRIAVSTLGVRESEGRHHPPFRKIGKEKFYPKDKFWEWFEAQPLTKQIKK